MTLYQYAYAAQVIDHLQQHECIPAFWARRRHYAGALRIACAYPDHPEHVALYNALALFLLVRYEPRPVQHRIDPLAR